MISNQRMNIIFNKIDVNTIDTASGIFIGTNHAHGWSSHNKNNSGLGTANNTVISGNLNMVHDNDIVDSPIDDRDVIYSHQARLGQTDIDFKMINVNALDTNATISTGENVQNGWDTHSKNNFGQGTVYGNTISSNNINSISDNDIIDTPINDQDYKPSIKTER
jgi:hypothetical protein